MFREDRYERAGWITCNCTDGQRLFGHSRTRKGGSGPAGDKGGERECDRAQVQGVLGGTQRLHNLTGETGRKIEREPSLPVVPGACEAFDAGPP